MDLLRPDDGRGDGRGVLFVEHKTIFGGGQVALLALLRAALENPRDGIEPLLVCPPSAELLPRARDLPLPIHTFDLGRIRKSRSPLLWAWNVGQRLTPTYKLTRLIRRERVGVVFANGAYSFISCVGAAKITRTPIIWWEHNTTLPRGNILRALIRAADHIVVVTEVIRQQFSALVPTAQDKITTIHNGVDPKVYRQDSQGGRARAALGFAPDALVVGTVGRLAEEKGQALLLQAAAALKPRVPQVRFLVVGAGPARLDLEKRAVELGLHADVVFTGFREDVADLLQAMDVFVLPSLEEALPIALLEAMAAGKPVVAADVGGVREAVVEGETGFLFRAGDHQAMARWIEALLCTRWARARRAQLGTRARARVESEFTFEETWRRTVGVLHGVARGHPVGAEKVTR